MTAPDEAQTALVVETQSGEIECNNIKLWRGA